MTHHEKAKIFVDLALEEGRVDHPPNPYAPAFGKVGARLGSLYATAKDLSDALDLPETNIYMVAAMHAHMKRVLRGIDQEVAERVLAEGRRKLAEADGEPLEKAKRETEVGRGA